MARRRGNGEGSITRRKDGLYMARYFVETPKGPKRRTLYGKTREEARDKMARALADRIDGLVFDDENVTVGEYLDSWLKGSVRGSVGQSTLDRYEGAVRVHIKPALGRLKLKKLAPAHLAGFYQDRLAAGSAPASVNKLHVTLHKALDQAVRWRMVPRNVAEAVSAPRPAPPEILKWQDVDLENSRVSVRRTITVSEGRMLLGEPKTKKSRRTIRLTDAAVRALREHLARQLEWIEQVGDLYGDQGLVFASEVGTPLNPSNLRTRPFAALLKRARLPRIRFHDLRHTCATLLLGRNVHPKYVQELLGHANIAITLDTYSHVVPGMGDHAAREMEDALSASATDKPHPLPPAL